MAGRLTGTLDGRPVVIEGDDAGLTLTIATVRGMWALRRSAKAAVPGLAVLKRAGVAVRVTIAGLVTLEVLPRPSALARLFAPGVADLA